MSLLDGIVLITLIVYALWSHRVRWRSVSDVRALNEALKQSDQSLKDLADQLALATTMLGAAEEKLAATRERADRAEQMYVRLRRGM